MKVTFIHTADWQLGKPFAGVEDQLKRSILQNERMEVIRRIGNIAKESNSSFVLVAGDLFDSSTATKSTVSAACSAIGSIGLPVYVIPGNHDHGGAGGIWEQEFYLREQKALAPNLHILLKAEPVELENVVLFPCPLLRRHESIDTTTWLRNFDFEGKSFGDKPLIVLAHGSIQSFGAFSDDEESEGGALNQIDLDQLQMKSIDYIALGDWHGTKEVGENVWYSGTPELDRFPKGNEHKQGNTLVVSVTKGEKPEVKVVETKNIKWHEFSINFTDDLGLNYLNDELKDRIGINANKDLVHLHLDGSLGLEAYSNLEIILESFKSRLIRLKLDNLTTISPNSQEMESLTQRANDPLISRVATKLIELSDSSDSDEASVARIALRELYIACNTK